MLQVPGRVSINDAVDFGKVTVKFQTRRARQIVEFWRKGCNQGEIPDRDHFDPLRLAYWIGNISIYEKVEGARDFRNRLEGTNISRLTGQNWQGYLASEIDEVFESTLNDDLHETLDSSAPQIRVMPVFQKEFLQAERVLLPISSNGVGADQIFLAMFEV